MPGGPVLLCVPNISEGRREEALNRIASASRGPDVHLLDLHSDPDHNRAVLTLAGSMDSLVGAVVAVAAEAARQIDLRDHRGVHPRIGAIDVVPFIPVLGSPMEVAAEAARTAAREIFERTGVPCFYYGEAASRAQARELPAVRRLAFNQLPPDVGASRHPTAGAVAVGARGLLVAYNVNIEADLAAARQIAKQVRDRDGGLPYLRAMGVWLASRGLAQVSMNLTRPEATTIPAAFDAVAAHVSARGLKIVEAELVGLAPEVALGGRIAESVGLNSPPKILEAELARAFGG